MPLPPTPNLSSLEFVILLVYIIPEVFYAFTYKYMHISVINSGEKM